MPRDKAQRTTALLLLTGLKQRFQNLPSFGFLQTKAFSIFFFKLIVSIDYPLYKSHGTTLLRQLNKYTKTTTCDTCF